MATLTADGPPVSESTVLSMVSVYESSGWYELSRQNIPEISEKKKAAKPMDFASLLKKGKELSAALARSYSRHACSTDNEKKWMRITAKDPFLARVKTDNATLADALDSMAVLASECCVMNYVFISELLSMCKNKKVRIMLCAMERLHAVFMEILPNAKLRYIQQLDEKRVDYLSYHVSRWMKHGEGNWDNLDSLARLMLHAVCFEDFLKGAYSVFIQVISDQLRGVEMFIKRKMLHYAFEMLARKPEQESLLMDLLVSELLKDENKMAGEAAKKIAELLICQSGMKAIVVRRIGMLLSTSVNKVREALKSRTSKKMKHKHSRALPSAAIPALKAIYRCVLFVSGLTFSKKEAEATSEALKAYMTLLTFIFSRFEDANSSHLLPLYEYEEFSRIIRCISSGIERCIIKVNNQGGFSILDYCASTGSGSSREQVVESINALYRAAHRPISFSTNIGLLSLIYKLLPLENRFYNLLYERVLDIRMFDATNRTVLLLLLFKCLSSDTDITRIASFVKRLLQVAMCLTGSDVSSQISRLCRWVFSKNMELHRMVSLLEEDTYIPDKRDPRFSEAEKTHLWECYLNRTSYHPLLANDHCNMQDGNTEEDLNLQTSSLFQELGIISGHLRTGDFSFTQQAFWRENKKALPHQMLFKAYYEFKLECNMDDSRKKPATEADEELYDSDIEELDEINDEVSDTEQSTLEEDSDDYSTIQHEAELSGIDESSEGLDSSEESDSSDIEAREALATSYHVSDSECSEPDDDKRHDSGRKHLQQGVSQKKDNFTQKKNGTKKGLVEKKSDRDYGVSKEESSLDKRSILSKRSRRTPGDARDAVDGASKRQKRQTKADETIDRSKQRRLKEVSKLINKATKGSFADASAIAGLGEFL